MTEAIDPNQYIISRKRKKYKFALFANSPLCFELQQWKKKSVDNLEIGAGTAMFFVELATLHPEQTFLAVDVKGDRLQKGALEAEKRKLENIWFVRARADQLPELVMEHTLKSLWITFPDPFPRERSERRRMTHPYFLEKYEPLIANDGSLYLKHDNREFFDWSIEQLERRGWSIVEKTYNLHESDLDDDYKIETSYEVRWLGEGRKTNFFKARRTSN